MLPLTPLAGRESGCSVVGVPGGRGQVKKKPVQEAANQPTTNGSLNSPTFRSPSAVPEISRVTGIFCFFSEPPPPLLCIISEAKQRRSEPNPSRFRPSRRKRNKETRLAAERRAEYHHSEMVSSMGLCWWKEEAKVVACRSRFVGFHPPCMIGRRRRGLAAMG
ncbi:uncharacterized protein B0H64DRAFT_138156 [Chaetomium fimeti]|jgi:hypothetical protein|uniref:Uncharacterized protein n=1 Tax=Chaetomium fimeti TaxID=1854472 RepID=A0AAE0HEM8_9PEZI|nr:hypothetical protein B0H64DRAFT_138156 [Chaetomium fimeti]